jgi:hypothetical protein
MDYDGVCWPSVETIARGAGVSRRTAQRGVSELRRSGYLWVTLRKEETSLYRARKPPWLSPDALEDDF